jgi:hypothetical protein
MLCKLEEVMKDSRMRRLAIPFTAIVLLVGIITPSVSNSAGTASTMVVKQGAPCTYLGDQFQSGRFYVCVSSGGKASWSATCTKINQTEVVYGVRLKCFLVPTTNFLVLATSLPSVDPDSLVPQVGPTPVAGKGSTIAAGQSCKASDPQALKVSDGVLFCVPISDGTFKYIERFSVAPTIRNPNSPEDLNSARPTDQRGPLPQGWDPGAITYPIKNHLLVNSGTMNFSVVPIDFPDLPGAGSPSAVYGSDMATMSKWFDFFSNGKLKIRYQVEDKWHRAPKPSSHYDVGEGIDISKEGLSTKQLMQEFVEATKSSYDYSKVDSVLFVYPKTISKISKPVTRYGWLTVNGQEKGAMLMATSVQNYTDSPLWLWIAHEMFHHMGLVQHFPVDPPDWGIEWGGATHSGVLLPWNQSILDWLNPGQYYSVTAENVTDQKITLVPLEQSLPGMRTIFIRVSNSQVLMVVSHRKGEWSFNLPDSFYGTMVALFDTTKQTDRTGESGADKQDGVTYSKSGVYLHPVNNVPAAKNHVWNKNGTSDWGALMYLGDSITYKGVKIQLVASNNYDTVEISKG